MSALDHNLNEEQRIEKPTTVQANIMFQQALQLAALPGKTPQDCARRLSQMQWISFVRVLKQKNATEEHQLAD